MSINKTLNDYERIWNQNTVGVSQNELFRSSIPIGEVDFTDKFAALNLDKIFTGPSIVTKMMGDYNCNHLFRDSQNECDIVVYNTDQYTVLQPMGEPGRDLGEGHGSKLSHLMIVTHDISVVGFNEMLPSNQEETCDLETRISVMKQAVDNIRNNAPISQCGSKVIAKAKKLPWAAAGLTGIREFMATQIYGMSQERRSGRPGYTLNNAANQDIGGDAAAVACGIDEVFGNMDLRPRLFIQPPNKASQLLSHIHCFLLSDEPLPDKLRENYVDVDILHSLKQDRLMEMEDGGAALCRTPSVVE